MKVNANVSKETVNGASREMDLYPVDPSKTGGSSGGNGLSAYEIAVKNGFVGTEKEWLDSLNGTYLKMDNPNKRAFLGDVFYEDELERTYMNLGKTKVAHAISNKGVNVQVGDVIPSFKELVAGINSIKQNVNITLKPNVVLDELANVFGDIINATINEGQSIMFVKTNKRLPYYDFIPDYNENFVSIHEGLYPTATYDVKIYGASNALVGGFDKTNNMFKFETIKGKGHIIKDEEYFKFVVQINAPEGVQLSTFYDEAFISGSETDSYGFNLIAFNGTAYRSGILTSYYSTTGRAHNDLIFIKNRSWRMNGTADAKRFRFDMAYPKNLQYIQIVGTPVAGNHSYNLLYAGTNSNISVNENLNEFYMPWRGCYTALMSSSYNIVNVLDYAFGMSYNTINNFIDEIDVAAVTKQIEIRIRYSDVLNSGTSEAQALIDKMTAINAENSLIRFVI
ncbi:MAG: hypothetical protein ACRCTZ_00285 [Sarcina sp.]